MLKVYLLYGNFKNIEIRKFTSRNLLQLKIFHD